MLLDTWLLYKDWFAECAQRHGLTVMQAHLLHELEPSEPLRMNVLATELACDASHVTGIVDRLERRGLVERQSGDGDRRVKLIALTPLGERVRDALLAEMLEPPPALRRLPRKEQRILRELLTRLITVEIRG